MWRPCNRPVPTEIVHCEAVVKTFLHRAAAVRRPGADEADLPLRRNHQFRMVPQELHLHIHRQDGVRVSVEIGPLGHFFQELVERCVVNGGIAQKIEGSAELRPEIGLQSLESLAQHSHSAGGGGLEGMI